MGLASRAHGEQRGERHEVQVGTANFVDPGIYERMLGELAAYLERHGKQDVREVVRTLEYPGETRDGKTGGTP